MNLKFQQLLLTLEDKTLVIVEVTACEDDYVVERTEHKTQKYLELRAELAIRYQSKVVDLALAIEFTGMLW